MEKEWGGKDGKGVGREGWRGSRGGQDGEGVVGKNRGAQDRKGKVLVSTSTSVSHKLLQFKCVETVAVQEGGRWASLKRDLLIHKTPGTGISTTPLEHGPLD